MSRWVLRLVLANVFVFFLSVYFPGLQQDFCFYPALLLVRPWTLFTYMFLHDGIWHIFFNMLALYFFGPRLELEMGERHFLILYFFSGLVAAIASLVFTPHTAIVGASGAIFGVLLGYAHFWPRDRVYIWGILPVEVRFLVIIMTVLSLFGGLGFMQADVAHFAHLGGFLGGWLYLRWFLRGRFRRDLQREVRASGIKATDIQRWNAIQRDTLHEVNREEYDRVMTKLRTNGPDSLTVNERLFLDRFSQP